MMVAEADIITCRKPIGCIGRKERTEYLWLRVQGSDAGQLDALAWPIEINVNAEGVGTVVEKRRYCVPLDRLKKLYRIDLARTRDLNDDYQPFYPVNYITGECILEDAHAPLKIAGLVYDKLEKRFL